MDVESAVALITLALGIPAIVLEIVKHLGRKSLRDRLKQDIEIRSALPSSFPAREMSALDKHIQKQVTKLAEEDEMRRDGAGAGLAIYFLAATIGLVILAFYMGVAQSGWWTLMLIPASVSLVFGLVGATESFPRAIRDEKGNRIK
ncbi:hypothetical protein CIK70_08080 [Brachybacterium alimentarium]|uniref:hypothetical protein n=1 Tax=Brachybacterium alimentarium TaxID=47845 RepID=UPI000DF3A884|nr:hypothetical protein [Brachybacterium alimentarium]RCS79277.1 hypothetical protein CIK70_08080 [Brachybacterium alimentarium]